VLRGEPQRYSPSQNPSWVRIRRDITKEAVSGCNRCVEPGLITLWNR